MFKNKQKFILVAAVLVIIISAVFIASQALGVAVVGNLNMAGFKITKLGGDTDEEKFEAANEYYVDSSIAPPSALPNYFPKWDSAKKLTQSNVVESGSGVGLGVADPKYTLDIGGAMRFQPITAPTAAEGVIYYDSAAKAVKFFDGTQWR